jgi:imidazolonepropionase-like amidohydrolase
MMMLRRLALHLILLQAACTSALSAPRAEHGVAYTGGKWFDGTRFRETTMYVADGVFLGSAPSKIDSTINLAGGFVVPPFGDAHQHLVDPRIDVTIKAFMGDGIFYVKDMSNAPIMRKMIGPALNRPNSFDYISANQGWTGRDGHPVEIIERGGAQMGGPMAAFIRDSLDPGLVMMVETKDDIAKRWQYFMGGKPDFVKVYLLNSQAFEQMKTDPRRKGNVGMDPKLVPELVRVAHEAGLQVAAHVFTAFDFRAALEAGVDQIAHLPGGRATDPAPFLLTDDDAALAAKKKVTVVTTVIQHGDSAVTDRIMKSQYIHNIQLLRKHNVPLLLGSDVMGMTAATEFATLARSGLFSNLEMLRLWSVTTPQAIFPKRRIGSLAPGYEASFLVLKADPLADWRATRNIGMRVKQGHVLNR